MKPKSFIDLLSSKLSRDEPTRDLGPGKAGVAVVFRQGNNVELLLMKRAVKEGDPWSGQISFPGGRFERGDMSFRDTAIRETAEEMGIDLRRSAKFLGYLGLFTPRNRPVILVPSVFLLSRGVKIAPNREVDSYRWVPLSAFQSESSRSFYSVDRDGTKNTFPSFVIGDYIVWGLTERIISTLTDYL